MNIAIIIAGGSGKRMLQDIPKQFLTVDDIPVIVYTLEAFQKNAQIDEICVVTLTGWTDVVKAYAKQFGITKLTHVCLGGEVGQQSIFNGLMCIKDIAHDDDAILIHDAIRPMVSQEIINDCITKCREYGNAISVIPCNEVMLKSTNDVYSDLCVPRDNLKRTQTPQAVLFKQFLELHQEAKEKGIAASIATASLLTELGHRVYYSLGSEKNIKLTTPDDLDIFKALLHSKRSDWIHA